MGTVENHRNSISYTLQCDILQPSNGKVFYEESSEIKYVMDTNFIQPVLYLYLYTRFEISIYYSNLWRQCSKLSILSQSMCFKSEAFVGVWHYGSKSPCPSDSSPPYRVLWQPGMCKLLPPLPFCFTLSLTPFLSLITARLVLPPQSR